MLSRLTAKLPWLNDPDRRLKFVIVGTGRSGTTFTSEALTAAGVDVGHERCYGPLEQIYVSGAIGDSSWMAVPFLSGFRGEIFHQVRHPLSVIDSLVDMGLMVAEFEGPKHLKYRTFLEQHFDLVGDELVDATRFYVDWNLRCEQHAKVRYRVEDQLALLVDAVEEVLPGSGARLMDVLPEIDPATNSRERRGVARARPGGLTLDDLPEGPHRQALVEMANRYGYELA